MSEHPKQVDQMKEPFVVVWSGNRQGMWNALEVNKRLNNLWAQGQHHARAFIVGHEPWGAKR